MNVMRNLGKFLINCLRTLDFKLLNLAIITILTYNKIAYLYSHANLFPIVIYLP